MSTAGRNRDARREGVVQAVGQSEPSREPSPRRVDELADVAEGDAAREDAVRWARGLAGRGELGDQDNEALLALCLGVDVSTTDAAETRAARRLGDRLDALGGSAAAPDAELSDLSDGQAPCSGDRVESLVRLAVAVRAAAGTSVIDELANERLIQKALGAPAARGPRILRWGSVGALAVAAAAALFWVAGPAFEPTSAGPGAAGEDRSAATQMQAAHLIQSRSTQPLFDPARRFPVRGGESQRVDRIAAARATDLRANRYAMWGVR